MQPVITKRPYQAITTYTLPPTDHRPMRVKARTGERVGEYHRGEEPHS